VAHPFLEHSGPVVYAHRGGGAERPENSVAAFAHAVTLGFRYLETDARLSADGVLVALHDDRLERVTNGTGPVSGRTAAELGRLRLRDADGELTDEPVPMLEDLLRAWPEVRWNLDAKDASTVGPLGDLLERLGLLERCCVGSFSDRRLERLRARFGSALCTSLGPREVARVRAASFGAPVGAVRGHVAQVPARVPLPAVRGAGRWSVPLLGGRFLDACRRRGLPVHVWTVDDPVEMTALLDAGVDGFMTDRPSVAAALLRARGAWPD
jgi:glycerophosphoryl diester phosphodiesterase